MEGNDVLTLMLAAVDDTGQPAFTPTRSGGEAMTLVLAGTRPPLWPLTWAWNLLSHNPAQDWLDEELDTLPDRIDRCGIWGRCREPMPWSPKRCACIRRHGSRPVARPGSADLRVGPAAAAVSCSPPSSRCTVTPVLASRRAVPTGSVADPVRTVRREGAGCPSWCLVPVRFRHPSLHRGALRLDRGGHRAGDAGTELAPGCGRARRPAHDVRDHLRPAVAMPTTVTARA